MLKYLVSTIILLVLDSIYLFSIQTQFQKQIFVVQGSKMELNITAAILTYIFIIISLHYFILDENKSILDAFVLGLCTYAVYDFTTLALLKKWSWNLAIMDTLWGGVLFALTTYIYKIVTKKLRL